jgi:hypothetical protein
METFLLTFVFTKSEMGNKTVLKWSIFEMCQIVDIRRHLKHFPLLAKQH